MISVYTERYQKVLERLQAARHEAGLTQVEVAQAFGKPQSFVSKCESGERRIDVVELGAFASLYHKPLGYFTGESDVSDAGLSVDRRARRPPAGPRSGAAGKGLRPARGKARRRPPEDEARRRSAARRRGRAPSTGRR